jgi:hypothetical protein
MTKRVVYTAIFGGYDNLLAIEPEYIESGIDYLCFTDNRLLRSNTYQIIILPVNPLGPILANREIKIKVCDFLPSYQESIYIDGNQKVQGKLSELFRYIKDSQDYFAAFQHSRNSCLLNEASDVIRRGQANVEVVSKQIARYREEGFPEGLGLAWNGLLIRRHTSELAALSEKWYQELENGCHRDQLSLMYVLWKYGYTLNTLKDNPAKDHRHQFVKATPHIKLRNTTEKRLTVCLLCYNNNQLVRQHLIKWAGFSQDFLDRTAFILIDDGSDEPVDEISCNALPIDLSIYRIHTKISWNIGGARNLACHVANTTWVFLQDLDHFLTQSVADSILTLTRKDILRRTVHKFGRYNPTTGRDRPHPGAMLLPRHLYWKLGGCDEDFCGHYGYTDVHFFRQRVKKSWSTKVKVHPELKLVEDLAGSTNNLDRSNEHNKNLYEEKVQTQRWSTECLRFSWSKVR